MSRWIRPLAALEGLRLPRANRREVARRYAQIQAKSPVPLTARNRSFLDVRGASSAASIYSYLQIYGDDAVVHPIVSRLMEAVSETEWDLWQESASRDEQERTQITSHGVLDLLDNPNDFQSWRDIVEGGTQHFLLSGECNIALGFAAGGVNLRTPLDMWVLRPDRINPVPDPYEFLRGWIYIAPGDGERIPLETRELMRFTRPDPTDPYRGLGAVQALMRDLDAQHYTKDWQAAFFANSARPGGIITTEKRLDDDEFTELSQRWAEQHRGTSKAHRVAILENGMTWTESAFSLRDLQLAELDNVGRDKALVAFGFPKSALGIVEDVNRANAEAGEFLFARWLTRPTLVRWRSMLNQQLLPLYYGGGSAGRSKVRRAGVVLDFVDPVQENSELKLQELEVKAQVVVDLTSAGFDSAEVLELVDWPSLTYEAPAPPPVVVPSRVGQPQPELPPGGQPADDPVQDALVYARAALLAPAGVDMAMRWVVTGHPDANCCDPCEKNIGKTYRNRATAYADYPGGKSYIKCVGEEYGNHCRCRVVKRRGGK